MMMTTTTQHLGHAAGRARRVASAGWRPAGVGFRGLGTTGVGVTPYLDPTFGAAGNTNDTTKPAIATDTACMSIDGPTRRLGRRST